MFEIIKAFINPFIGVLTGLVIISFILDILLAEPGEQDWTAIVIISTMVVFSAILRFRQEWKANISSEALLKMVTNTCYVKRAGSPGEEISITELVPGDIVLLAAGDMVPADIRIIEAQRSQKQNECVRRQANRRVQRRADKKRGSLLWRRGAKLFFVGFF